MRKYVFDYCTTCDIYARAKPTRHKPYGLLKQLPIPERPWESISLDFIVELPRSQSDFDGQTYDAILVVVDRLTKQAHFAPTHNEVTSLGIARLFRDNV